VIPLEKPGTPAELVHHGVKGQKWGVRKVEDSKSRANKNTTTKENLAVIYKRNSEPVLPFERKQNLETNQKRWNQKFGLGDLTPTQKKVLIGVGVGATLAVAGGTYYYLHKGGKLPGQHLALSNFQELANASKERSWGGGNNPLYLQESSFKRPAFELPAGTVFHRISSVAETDFHPITYVTHNKDDLNRYLSATNEMGYKNYYGLKHITFSTKDSIKVPHVSEVLDTMREVMVKEGVAAHRITPENVQKSYMGLYSGDWTSPRASTMIHALAQKGFGAVVDEMDSGVIGETPLVLFKSDNLTPKIAKNFKTKEVFKGINSLTEIAYRK
jgi:hypothetical protein